MIDDMVVQLGEEQKDDEAQKKWCNTEFDASEIKDELAALAQGIKDLDKAVAEATEQRQEEHADFVSTSAQNNAAVQLLGVAKNRLNKFYNPALYVKPQRR